jgi:hypothetical protein
MQYYNMYPPSCPGYPYYNQYDQTQNLISNLTNSDKNNSGWSGQIPEGQKYKPPKKSSDTKKPDKKFVFLSLKNLGLRALGMIKWVIGEGPLPTKWVRTNVESGARIRAWVAVLGTTMAGLTMSPGETIVRKRANTAKGVLIVQTWVHGPVLSNFLGFKEIGVVKNWKQK